MPPELSARPHNGCRNKFHIRLKGNALKTTNGLLKFTALC